MSISKGEKSGFTRGPIASIKLANLNPKPGSERFLFRSWPGMPTPADRAEGCRWNHLTEEIRPEQLIFPNSLGKVESLSKIMQRGCQPSQIRAGVSVQTGETDKDGNPISKAKYTGFHSLRHFYASWCINRREDGGLSLPPKMVQERLGHSHPAMDTFGICFHAMTMPNNWPLQSSLF